MKRKIYDRLLEWKAKSNGSTALLIDGARRVGKSYIVEEFAKKEYASYVLVDFSKAKTKLKRIFNEYLDDLDTFFLYFERITHSRLVQGNALVIFDEVQKFPRAREAIKHLVADGRFHYIETGSLISINKNVKDILIPSEEHRIPMYPMDFEEFLWAMGDTATMPLVRKRFVDMKPLGVDVHRQIMDMFRQYMIVGGMPQAVAKFAATRDLEAVDSVKRDVLALYRADIQKYGGVLRHKALSVFNAIPSQLSRHEKRLMLSEVKVGGRMRDFESTFDWLESAMTVNVCRRATEPNVGLELATDRQSVKCYMGDTGLLVSHHEVRPGDHAAPVGVRGEVEVDAVDASVAGIAEPLLAQATADRRGPAELPRAGLVRLHVEHKPAPLGVGERRHIRRGLDGDRRHVEHAALRGTSRKIEAELADARLALPERTHPVVVPFAVADPLEADGLRLRGPRAGLHPEELARTGDVPLRAEHDFLRGGGGEIEVAAVDVRIHAAAHDVQRAVPDGRRGDLVPALRPRGERFGRVPFNFPRPRHTGGEQDNGS